MRPEDFLNYIQEIIILVVIGGGFILPLFRSKESEERKRKLAQARLKQAQALEEARQKAETSKKSSLEELFEVEEQTSASKEPVQGYFQSLLEHAQNPAKAKPVLPPPQPRTNRAIRNVASQVQRRGIAAGLKERDQASKMGVMGAYSIAEPRLRLPKVQAPKTRQDLRKAIVWAEILRPPVSLRAENETTELL